MALTINTLSSFNSQNAGQTKTASFESRLSINSRSKSSGSDTSSGKTGLSAEELAQRDTTLKLSNGASSINTKEYFTNEQISTIDSLLAKAAQISSEVDPTRAASIASDATSLISSNATQYAASLVDHPTLNQTETIFAVTNQNAPTGSSEGNFTTSVSSVQSLSSLGITTALSFNQATIENTIDALTAARSGLTSSLGGLASSRSDISAEVQAQGTTAQLVESSQAQPSIEDIARKAADQITQSTDSLLAHNKVEELDVATLLDSAGSTQQA